MRTISVRQAINEAINEEMDRDSSVILIGEDIAQYGGSLKVTGGLYDKFGPDRIRNTPLSESAIVGTAIGSSMLGIRTIAEITYFDFIGVSMDQIMNQAAKWQYMTGGRVNLPLVLRTQGGGYRGNGSQHSQSLEAVFTHIPGLVVVMPSSPFDFKGLLKSAIRDNNPVLFIEHKMIYNVKGKVPEEEYTIPFGCADIKREGKDLTVVATSYMVKMVMDLADELEEKGISIEVIDPRTLVPFDFETIKKSVEKTHRLVVVNEAHNTCSFAREISARVMEEMFTELDAPVLTVGALDVPIPYAQNLEEYVLPSKERIADCIKKAMEY
ncbi:alpha-ketoacid dehydrogenase subunit beta [Alkalibacter saccharofermentans]|uniref:Pyruvate dehydrogenase E1 component beta subunit n=1 Tax=Alkalibacter saccharofermentans DSM 14828 TaxID=1120975 RepID=A0A1M4U250_9FIRM|nr:alpha-ketoacid dehydrogenase subunit beta [Alkalibacter saccharofermentans]SHE50750.1 pyruvate dehydrogenase E1 component beta subunit [Alkalibacter saccharofermentans DSM 14828]